ncbi:MAG: hypothetical protein WA954_04485 [Parerythrobacter sp.]
MSENVENLILERLRRMDEKLDRIETGVRENRERLGHLERLYVSISHRVDTMDDRLNRMEKRFELRDAE